MLLSQVEHAATRTGAAGPHGEDFADLIQGEAESFCLADEPQAVRVFVAIYAVARGLALRRREQLLAFVKANSLDVDPGLPCEFANLHAYKLNPILGYESIPLTGVLRGGGQDLSENRLCNGDAPIAVQIYQWVRWRGRRRYSGVLKFSHTLGQALEPNKASPFPQCITPAICTP